MKDGDLIRLRGSAGAPFMVTVGQPFTQAEIEKRLKSGEWGYWDGNAPEPHDDNSKPPVARTEPQATPQTTPDPDRPTLNAPKSDWVAYVARTRHMSLDDAANYTKADLIDMGS